MTIDDLHDAPDDGTYELVAGQLIHRPPLGLRPARIAGNIRFALLAYERVRGGGMAIGGTMALIVRRPSLRSFSPAAGFVMGEIEETDDFYEGAPIFAVEIRAKGDHTPRKDVEYAEKRAAYFAAGTRVVWDVNPRRKTVAAYRAEAPDAPRLFHAGEIADAEPALPGWRVAVHDLMG